MKTMHDAAADSAARLQRSEERMSTEATKSLAEIFARVPRKTIKWSNYFPIYQKLFAKYVGKPITFVEVGILNGGSLQMWRQFFGTQARIIGIDLNPAAHEMERDGFEIHIGDQADPEFWRAFFQSVGPIDVLLDDGGHTNLQQIVTVAESAPQVRDGGVVVTEDTHTSYMKREFNNPSPHSFVNFARHLIDVINRRNPRTEHSPSDRRGLGAHVHSIEFFDSIVAFHIDRTMTATPTLMTAGTETFTAQDFRHASSPAKSTSALRRAYQRMPAWLKACIEPVRRIAGQRVSSQDRRATDYFS